MLAHEPHASEMIPQCKCGLRTFHGCEDLFHTSSSGHSVSASALQRERTTPSERAVTREQHLRVQLQQQRTTRSDENNTHSCKSVPALCCDTLLPVFLSTKHAHIHNVCVCCKGKHAAVTAVAAAATTGALLQKEEKKKVWTRIRAEGK